MKLGAKALEGGERNPGLLAAPFELYSTLVRNRTSDPDKRDWILVDLR